jgi:O-antigen/teichoic acid export membrane protein
VSTGIAVVLGLLTTSLAVRLLGTGSYGALAFALAVLTVVAGVTWVGLRASIPKAVAAADAAEDVAAVAQLGRGALIVTLVTGALGAAAAAVLIVVAPLDVGHSTRVVLGIGMGVLVVGTNAAAMASSLARGFGRVVLAEAPDLVLAFGKAAVICGLAVAGAAELRWVGIGYGAVGAATLAASFALAARLLSGLPTPAGALGATRRVIVSSTPFFLTGLTAIAVSRFDVLVLGIVGTDAEVGVYEPTLKVSEQVMLMVQMAFTVPYLPTAARLVTNTDVAALGALYLRVSKVVYLMAFPLALLLTAFPEAVLATLYGDGFPANPDVVWLLLIGLMVNLMLGVNLSTLSAVAGARVLGIVGAVGLVSMLGSALALIPGLGPEGAALATSVTYLALNVASSVALFRLTRIHPIQRDFMRVVSISMLALGGALALRSVGGGDSIWWAVSCTAALSAAWMGVLAGIGAVGRDDLRALRGRLA